MCKWKQNLHLFVLISYFAINVLLLQLLKKEEEKENIYNI